MAVELNDTTANKWSGTDANNTSSPPDGAPGGTFPNQAEGIWRGQMGTIKRAWDRDHSVVASTGSAGLYLYTPANTSFPTAYAQGDRYSFKANFTSVGGDLMNVNGLGPRPLVKAGGTGLTAIAAGDIQINQNVETQYNSTYGGSGALQMTSPVAGASGNPVSGPGSSGSGNLAYYNGTGGNSIADSGIATALIAHYNAAEMAVTASATLAAFASTSENIVVNGTATITAFDNIASGLRRFIRFAATCVLIHSTATLILCNGGSNITTAPGDTCVAQAFGSITRIVDYQPASGQAVGGGIPAGFIGPYGGATAPSGWVFCDGSSLLVASFGSLFTAIGYAYGGSGANFNVPDMRGRTAFGNDAMNGATAAGRITSTTFSPDGKTLGATGGAQTVTLSNTELPSHNHKNPDGALASAGCAPSAVMGGGAPGVTNSTGNTGGGGATNKMNPGIITNFIIKT